MSGWNRATPWRQGHLLDDDTVKALALSNSESPDKTAVMVISHDCDLAQPIEREPYVEVIVGRFLEEKANGNFTHAKNIRKLHLEQSSSSESLTVELVATCKTRISKQQLAGAKPSSNFRLSTLELSVLQNWLAARYRRAAFPDEFDRRLKDQTKLAEKIRAILKTRGEHIDAIFFDVDNGEDTAHSGVDDPFKLAVYLIYSTQKDEETAREDAEAAAELFDKAFREKCLTKERRWEWIELVVCEAMAEILSNRWLPLSPDEKAGTSTTIQSKHLRNGMTLPIQLFYEKALRARKWRQLWAIPL